MNNLQSITVIGGSAASPFENGSRGYSWPELLKRDLIQSKVNIYIRPGLTFVRALDLLIDVPPCNILIFHFGTSVGWPISIIKLGHTIGIDFASEAGFHQPAFKSHNKSRRLGSFLRTRFRNSVKWILFFLGLYRPRTSKREMADQIQALLHFAFQKSDRVIWLQHQALRRKRIILERITYKKYYRQIVEELDSHKGEYLEVIELPDDFVSPDNYLLDCVHLSQLGHRRIYELVKEAI